MNKFTYKIYGLKGSVVFTDFMNETEIEIIANKISEASENIKQYLANNFLQADKIILIKIELLIKK